jgi:hypothetical protein
VGGLCRCDSIAASLYELVFKGTRLIIPTVLRNDVLKELHCGHLGILKMKLLARSYVYWKIIDKEIEELVKSCRERRMKQNEPAKVPPHHWEPPSAPWERIHIDFAGPIDGYHLFIIVDAYTKWVEVFPTKTTTAPWCIKTLEQLFAIFGLPYTLVSDNGRQFVSADFENYLQQNKIQHKKSAPYHPATNGQAERYVQTVKNSLKTMSHNGGNIHNKLLEIKTQLRRTPLRSTGLSPYETMFGRTIRTYLHACLDKPNSLAQSVSSTIRNSEHLRSFQPGQRVQARNYVPGGNKWVFATVQKRLGRLHYELRTDDGTVWRRHLDQLIATKIPPPPLSHRLEGEDCYIR